MNCVVNVVVRDENNSTGVSNYARALTDYFTAENINFRTISTQRNVPKPIILFCRLFSRDIVKFFETIPLFLKLPRNEIIHFTEQQQAFSLLFRRRKSIVTVHDLVPLATNDEPFFRRLLLKIAFTGLRRAKLLIADSEHTKKDIIRLLRYPERKIKVVPLGVNHNYFRPAKIKRDNATVLYVGSEMPRKNLITLFKAFTVVKQKIPEAKLVKVGLPQWPGARKRLLRFVKKNNLQDSVIFKDYVENLAEEYQKATIFVFPSKYEGFGLPPLEAMACGCPVICSNATSLPEVVGDASLLFNPYNIRDLSEKIRGVLTNKKLQKQLSLRGIKQSLKFSWNKTAEKTSECYELIH